MAKGVVIGSKFTGPNAAANTQSGEFWAVLPELTGTDLKIQKMLLEADKFATAREKVNALPRTSQDSDLAKDLSDIGLNLKVTYFPGGGATGTAVSVNPKKV